MDRNKIMKINHPNYPTNQLTNHPTKLSIVFFGTPENAATTLERLIDTDFKPALVITGSDIQKGRGRNLQSTPVKEIADANHIKVLEPQNLGQENFLKLFRDFSPDVAILIAYGKIIPSHVLTIPRHGFVNIHPSLLPKYRGPSPIYQALLNGDKKTGVTLIKLDAQLDHGPIIAQKELVIEANDTHESLAQRLAFLGADLLVETLPSYLNGSIKLNAQDESKVVWTEKITKEDGRIDLENPPNPEKLDRMIRAFYPWPGVWAQVGKLRIKFLPGNLIQPEGKKPMTIKEFLNGYPQAKEVIEKLIKQERQREEQM